MDVLQDATRVEFHGRSMTARALFEEKRRFVQRWPERHYRPRPETLRAACDPDGGICTVRTVFDFTAINPERGRRSQGAADLELEVIFVCNRQEIVAETSRVIRRGNSSPSASFETQPE